jgi:hypothetical protein
MLEAIHLRLLDSPEQRTEVEIKAAPPRKAPEGIMIEDDFGSCLKKLRGTVSKDLDLEF